MIDEAPRNYQKRAKNIAFDVPRNNKLARMKYFSALVLLCWNRRKTLFPVLLLFCANFTIQHSQLFYSVRNFISNISLVSFCIFCSPGSSWLQSDGDIPMASLVFAGWPGWDPHCVFANPLSRDTCDTKFLYHDYNLKMVGKKCQQHLQGVFYSIEFYNQVNTSVD